MKIKTTREASPAEAEVWITKQITALLIRNTRANTEVSFPKPVAVIEGPEDCGSGKLHVSALVRVE